MDLVTKANFNDELKKIKKKEQELYKFILQQFLDLEEFKKSFSTSIAKTVDSKLALVDETLTSLNVKSGVGGLPVEEIRKIISDSIKARDEKHALTEEKIKDLVTKTLALQKLEVIQKSSLTEDKVLDLINKSGITEEKLQEVLSALKEEFTSKSGLSEAKVLELIQEKASGSGLSEEKVLELIHEKASASGLSEERVLELIHEKASGSGLSEERVLELIHEKAYGSGLSEERVLELIHEKASGSGLSEERVLELIHEKAYGSGLSEERVLELIHEKAYGSGLSEEKVLELIQEKVSTVVSGGNVSDDESGIKLPKVFKVDNDIPDLLASLLQHDEIVIFLSDATFTKLTLPKPNERLFGKMLSIINTGNYTWKVNVSDDGKIGGQNEKTISKNGQYLKLVSDGQKYFVI